MPLTRIDTSEEWTIDQARLIGEIVFDVMREVLGVPGGDKFQVIQRHPVDSLNVTPSYLGIRYTDRIVIIQITLNQGRDTEIKKNFYARLADRLKQDVGVRRDDVLISLIEVPKENWSFGEGVAQYADN